jgi:hypothetical protein
VQELTEMQSPGGEYAGKDDHRYHVLHAAQGEYVGVPQGKYLVDDSGQIVYLVDPAINGRVEVRDDGTEVTNKLEAPKTRLMALIIDGILNGKLPWELVLIGALIAIVLELAGVPSLPFAVGVYLPIQTSMPIFIGGMLRWIADKLSGKSEESDSSPAVLLSSGYIAGGSIAGVLIGFMAFSPWLSNKLNLTFVDPRTPDVAPLLPVWWSELRWPAIATFSVLMFVLFLTGVGVLFRDAKLRKRSGGK